MVTPARERQLKAVRVQTEVYTVYRIIRVIAFKQNSILPSILYYVQKAAQAEQKTNHNHWGARPGAFTLNA